MDFIELLQKNEPVLSSQLPKQGDKTSYLLLPLLPKRLLVLLLGKPFSDSDHAMAVDNMSLMTSNKKQNHL